MKATSVPLNLNLTPFTLGTAEQLLHCQYLGCWGPWATVLDGTLRWTDHDNKKWSVKAATALSRQRDCYPGQARAAELPRGGGRQQDRVLAPARGHAPPHSRQVQQHYACTLFLLLELSTKFHESSHNICLYSCVNFRYIDTSSIVSKFVDTTWTMMINYQLCIYLKAFHNMHILSPSWQQCTEMLKVKSCSRSEQSFVTPCPGCCLGMREYTGPRFQCYQLCMHTRNQTFALGVSSSRLFSLNCSRSIALSKQSWKKKAFTTRKKLCFSASFRNCYFILFTHSKW